MRASRPPEESESPCHVVPSQDKPLAQDRSLLMLRRTSGPPQLKLSPRRLRRRCLVTWCLPGLFMHNPLVTYSTAGRNPPSCGAGRRDFAARRRQVHSKGRSKWFSHQSEKTTWATRSPARSARARAIELTIEAKAETKERGANEGLQQIVAERRDVTAVSQRRQDRAGDSGRSAIKAISQGQRRRWPNSSQASDREWRRSQSKYSLKATPRATIGKPIARAASPSRQ